MVKGHFRAQLYLGGPKTLKESLDVARNLIALLRSTERAVCGVENAWYVSTSPNIIHSNTNGHATQLLLGVGGSPASSPVRSPPVAGFPGGHPRINTQVTGTTTIARQFTGAGGSEAILRQFTGGGLSPTRSISPTKQLGMFGSGNGGMRPRPKSAIGMRNTKSVDEGRGMFLVRQLTGATSTGGWAES